MKINCFEKVVSEEEARKKAEKRGGFIGKLLIKDDVPITIKPLYIENKIITLEMEFLQNFISKILFKNKKRNKGTKIRLIGNGSTGGVAYYDSPPKLETKEVNEENIQLSVYDDDTMIRKGKTMARKMVRRQIGGNVIFNLFNIESVFRPYYVAFYGEMKEGNKVRYIAISADAGSLKRTF